MAKAKAVLRIRPSVLTAIPPEVRRRLEQVQTAHLSDNMARTRGMHAAIRPWHGSAKLIGTALTVRTRAGDNLLIHHAADIVRPGQVIVVDGGGDESRALIGEIVCRLAQRNGAVGFVLDGAIRDSEAIRAMGFPVFARAATHVGPYKNGPGEINVPITCGGVPVHPGDLVVGDADGVVVIDPRDMEAVVAAAYAQWQDEEATLARIAAGGVDRAWVRARLETDPDYEYRWEN
ncbi:MAG: RraA family protein [Actinomycetia bacterium]|nr:RraA family protein [Actinomycetes bacterium]